MNALTALGMGRTRSRSASHIVPLPVAPRDRRGRVVGADLALRPILADLCYFALRLAGWLALTALATLGLYALLFMALGAFTVDGFFAHLANLSTRFGEADAARQTLFVRQLSVVTLVLFLAVSTARYRSFLAVFSGAPAPRKD